MSEGLRNWIREQGLSVAEFADRLGKPLKTVEKWVYQGKTPSNENRASVYSVTRLIEFQPSGEEHERPDIARIKSAPASPSDKVGVRQPIELLVRNLSAHIRMAEEILRFFTGASPEARDILRSQLDPKRVAYFSGLLRAILSEERLREFEIAAEVSSSLQQSDGGGKHGRDVKG